MSNTEMFPIVYQPGDPIPAALANLITDALERIFDQGVVGQLLTKTVTGQGIETIGWAPPPSSLAVEYQPPFIATFGANGTLTDFEIVHNLDTTTPHVQFWEPDGTGQYVQLDGVEVISASNGMSISVSFDAEAPASGTVVNVSTGGGAGGPAITAKGGVDTSADLADIVDPELWDGYFVRDTGHVWLYTDSDDPGAVAGFDDTGAAALDALPLPLYGITGYTAALPSGESVIANYSSITALRADLDATAQGERIQVAEGNRVEIYEARLAAGNLRWERTSPAELVTVVAVSNAADAGADIETASLIAGAGGRLVFPSGTFYLTAGIEVQASGQTWDMGSATLVRDFAGYTPMITSTVPVHIVGGTLDGDYDVADYNDWYGDSTDPSAINLESHTGSTVTATAIVDSIYGVNLETCTACVVDAVRVDGIGALIEADGTNFANFHPAIRIIGGARNKVTGCDFIDVGSGVLVGSTSSRPIIFGNTIDGAYDNGIYLSSAASAVVQANSIKNVPNGSGVKSRGSNASIIGNSVAEASVGIGVSGFGIDDGTGYGAGATTISANTLTDIQRDGINIGQWDDAGWWMRGLSITGNTIDLVGQEGSPFAGIRGTCDHSTIVGNTIDRCEGIAGMLLVGIDGEHVMTGVTVATNRLRDITGYALLMTDAAGCVIANNSAHDVTASTVFLFQDVDNSDIVHNSGPFGTAKTVISEDSGCTGNLIFANTGTFTGTGHSISGTSHRLPAYINASNTVSTMT